MTETRTIKTKRASVPEAQDIRFQNLIGAENWCQLPQATRQRFSRRITAGESVVYVGTIIESEISWFGRALANLLRFIGAPLPLSDNIDVPSIVSVTEDVATSGQIWSRLYANNSHFPQVIHSAKRFSGPTGLEEYIGFGLQMALTVRVTDSVLIFESAGFTLGVFGARLPIPAFLVPGKLTVTHEDEGDGQFQFSLTLRHKFFGDLVHQVGIYREELR